MVKRLLQLDATPQADAADALATAITRALAKSGAFGALANCSPSAKSGNAAGGSYDQLSLKPPFAGLFVQIANSPILPFLWRQAQFRRHLTLKAITLTQVKS